MFVPTLICLLYCSTYLNLFKCKARMVGNLFTLMRLWASCQDSTFLNSILFNTTHPPGSYCRYHIWICCLSTESLWRRSFSSNLSLKYSTTQSFIFQKLERDFLTNLININTEVTKLLVFASDSFTIQASSLAGQNTLKVSEYDKPSWKRSL